MNGRICIFNVAAVIVAFSSMSSLGLQAQPDGEPPHRPARESLMQTQQGQPGQVDVIAHRHVAKNTHLKCIQAEHNSKRVADQAGCLLRFEDGDRHILSFGELIKATKDGEVYLECAGDRPTRCIIAVW